MNTGTQAAPRAKHGRSRSNLPKLIEVVEIASKLLMTRGALTTFSIANERREIFRHHPAMFLGVLSATRVLNVMHLASPQSAILSAHHLHALIIIA